MTDTKPKILIVDNDIDICNLFKDFFDFIGYDSIYDTDGERVFRILETLDYDLMFVDLKMGTVSGIDIIRKSKQVHPLSEVIVVTGFGSEETVLTTLQYGAASYIQKPISFVDIRVQADQALARRRFGLRTDRLRHLAAGQDTELSTHIDRLLDLDKLSRYLNLTIDLDMLSDTLLHGLAEIVPADIYQFLYREESASDLVLHAPGTIARSDVPIIEEKITAAFAKQTSLKVETYHLRLSRTATFDENAKGIITGDTAFLYAPVIVENAIRGMIGITLSPDAVGPDTLDMLYLVSTRVSPVLTNATLHRETKMLALTDGLTGLLNHRAFHERLNLEFERFRRYGSSLSLILADYDDLKMLNDSYGHPVGDEVLRRVGQILRETSRETDILARYGGDEFVILLPQTNAKNALNMAERIRQRIVNQAIRINNHEIRSSVSMGIATIPGEGVETPHDLFASADRALYQAKGTGKNRIVEAHLVD